MLSKFLSHVLLLNVASATFSSNFLFFLEDLYGRDLAESLARTDIGHEGSFGGGFHQPKRRTDEDAVVFVHGYTGYADDFADQVAFMKMQGYDDTTLYGTTYGEWSGPVKRMNQTGMACKYVLAVRRLIVAVNLYTDRPVNVIGVSMGGAISRKAIMGGGCVETGENLGKPLTNIISNYVGVVGVMHGAAFCEKSDEAACNANFGMKCNSIFLQDINSKTNYEGRRRFVIESTGDTLVGYYACGTHPSEYVGGHIIKYHGFDHTATYRNSFQVQYMLVSEQF
ncbi:unnamed protein product [Bursaphelenchus xylophilus]|uniref:(pine wood nematode) hypothetical protein n=1 Tax=Bursaphelenchus xylophilus TaxID=6326 RepID=A0A1I7S7S1_BURXY|nr:unnamed protein product [Bursaphelenchus xylophilus]CAG9086912.1 unnamed protein product [Bursaphelenchus xylophilus]